MYKEYSITAALCALIRFFALPNSFQMASDFPENSLLVLIIVEPILQFVTYNVVGMYYHKGRDNPIKGSLLYLAFYAAHTGLFYLVGAFGFNIVAFAITAVLYFVVHIGFAKFMKFLFGGV